MSTRARPTVPASTYQLQYAAHRRLVLTILGWDVETLAKSLRRARERREGLSAYAAVPLRRAA